MFCSILYSKIKLLLNYLHIQYHYCPVKVD